MSDYLRVQIRCVRVTVLVPVIVLPLLVVTTALVFTHVRYTTKVHSEDEIRTPLDVLLFYPSPIEPVRLCQSTTLFRMTRTDDFKISKQVR